MASRISELDASSIGAGNGNPVEAVRPGNPVGPATTGNGSSTGSGANEVHITSSARALVALSQAVQEAPEVDSTRVATLQQQINSGQYSVDPDRIAGSLLQIEQDLAGTHQ